MTKKQKLQKFLNSVVKSHGDIDEDWKEIENDVKKLLELFENNREGVSDRSDFLSLVNDITKRYHALYGRHDGLISKIKNKVQHRKGESRSESSDSGSDDSSNEDGPTGIHEQKIVEQKFSEDCHSFKERIDSLSKQNAELEALTASMQTKLEESQHLAGELIESGTVIVKLEDELQTVRNSLKLLNAENEFLKTEMEKSKEQEGKLSLQVNGLREENEVLMSEKEKVSSMLLQADGSIIELKFELEKMMIDAGNLREENSFLKEDLEKKAKEMVHLNQQIVLTGEEGKTLRVLLTDLESTNNNLMSENARIDFENQSLKAQKEAAIQQVSNHQDNLLMLEEENDALKSQVLKLSTHMHEADENIKDMKIESELLKEDISKLHDTITDLNHQLKVKDNENCVMKLESSESGKVVQQAEERILILSVEVERLKSENSMLLIGVENLKLQVDGSNQELTKLKLSLEATESKINSLKEENILLLGLHENLELELEGNNQELTKLRQASEATENERNSLIEEKKALLSKINEGGMVIDGLHAQIEEAESEKSQLKLKIINLDLESQSSNIQFTDLKNALVAAEDVKKALVSEISVVKSMLQEAEFTKERLQSELEELNQKNSILLSNIEEVEKDVKIESGLLKEEISKLHDTIFDLNHQLKVKTDENYAMILQYSESKKIIQQAEERVIILSLETEKVKSENSMLLAGHENLKLELEGINQEFSILKQASEATESEKNSIREEKSLLLSAHESLKLELEGNNQELLKLKQALEVTEFERNSLIEEKSALLNKINEDEVAIDGLKALIEEVESEKSQLQLKISNLDLEIQSAYIQFTDVKNALVAAEEEKKICVSENLIIECKLQEEQFMKGRLQIEVGELNQKNSILLSKLEEAETDMLIQSKLRKEDISKLNDSITYLNNQLKVKDDENYAMALDSSESRKVIGHAEERIMFLSVEAERMKTENSMLLTEQENLKHALEDNSHELLKHKQDFEAIKFEVNSLKQEKSLLLSSHENLKLELEGYYQQHSKLKQSLEATEFERNSLIEEKLFILTKINEGGMAINGLKAQIEELEKEKCQLQLKISDLDFEIQSANLQFTNVKNDLVAAEEEKKALASKNSVVESKLHEVELTKEILQTELVELNQKNSILLSKIEEVEKATNDLKFQRDELIVDNEQLKIKVKELITELEEIEFEMNSLKQEKSLLLSGHKNLKLELEGYNQQQSKLKQVLEATEFERNSLIEEKSFILTKINEGGMAINGLKAQIEELEKEKCQLQLKISDLDFEIQSANIQFTNVKNALVAAEEDKKALASENSVVKSKLHEVELTKEILQTELVELNQKNYILLNKIDEAEMATNDLKFQRDEQIVDNEQVKIKVKELITELEAIEFEMNSLKQEKSLLLSGHENLKLELEGNNRQHSTLKQALEATEFERNSLIEEKSFILTKINEGGMAINCLKAQIEELEKEKCQLQLKISDLDFEIQSTNLQFTNVKNALVAAEEEKKALASENYVVESKLHEVELTKEILQTELVELNQKKSILLSKIEEAEKATNDFKFQRDELIVDNEQLKIKVKELIMELEAANIRLNNLEKLIAFAEEEKTKFVSEISILTCKLQLTEVDNKKLERERDLLREENSASQQNQERLQNKIADYYKKLEVTSSEIQDLKDRLELTQKEALHEFETWTDTLKGDLLEMVTEKGDLDQELKKLLDVSSENEVSLKKMEDTLRSKILDQETLLKNYEDLLPKHKQLEDSYRESCTKLETAEKNVEQMEMKEVIIQRLERICTEQKHDIGKWGENCRELLEKLSSTELGKLNAEKEIQRLEVQLRLSNQKLKITETEYKEKEDNLKGLVAGFQEELKLLDRHALICSTKSTELNNEFKQIKVVLQTVLETLVNELDVVESISLENMRLIKKQLAECLVELQSLKASLKSQLHEKKKFKNENYELSAALTYKEGIILKLKDEASRNLAQLVEKENELKNLENRVAESEKDLKEKERVVLDKDEEKREAIRQLCLVIEYHWENRNYLVRYLSSVLQSRGTS